MSRGSRTSAACTAVALLGYLRRGSTVTAEDCTHRTAVQGWTIRKWLELPLNATLPRCDLRVLQRDTSTEPQPAIYNLVLPSRPTRSRSPRSSSHLCKEIKLKSLLSYRNIPITGHALRSISTPLGPAPQSIVVRLGSTTALPVNQKIIPTPQMELQKTLLYKIKASPDRKHLSS